MVMPVVDVDLRYSSEPQPLAVHTEQGLVNIQRVGDMFLFVSLLLIICWLPVLSGSNTYRALPPRRSADASLGGWNTAELFFSHAPLAPRRPAKGTQLALLNLVTGGYSDRDRVLRGSGPGLMKPLGRQRASTLYRPRGGGACVVTNATTLGLQWRENSSRLRLSPLFLAVLRSAEGPGQKDASAGVEAFHLTSLSFLLAGSCQRFSYSQEGVSASVE
ncbi:hypothetical protein BaRGS_00013640, partial [Batillaria attramentaria]